MGWRERESERDSMFYSLFRVLSIVCFLFRSRSVCFLIRFVLFFLIFSHLQLFAFVCDWRRTYGVLSTILSSESASSQLLFVPFHSIPFRLCLHSYPFWFCCFYIIILFFSVRLHSSVWDAHDKHIHCSKIKLLYRNGTLCESTFERRDIYWHRKGWCFRNVSFSRHWDSNENKSITNRYRSHQRNLRNEQSVEMKWGNERMKKEAMTRRTVTQCERYCIV